jgi:predicted heme/steroid binding protein
MMGSKQVDHLTSETVYECSEIAGSPWGSPPAAHYVGYEAGRKTCSERETRTEELCEIKWDYPIVGTTA